MSRRREKPLDIKKLLEAEKRMKVDRKEQLTPFDELLNKTIQIKEKGKK